MTCYKFNSSHWLKLQHPDWRANFVKDFFLNKSSTNESNLQQVTQSPLNLTNNSHHCHITPFIGDWPRFVWSPPWTQNCVASITNKQIWSSILESSYNVMLRKQVLEDFLVCEIRDLWKFRPKVGKPNDGRFFFNLAQISQTRCQITNLSIFSFCGLCSGFGTVFGRFELKWKS